MIANFLEGLDFTNILIACAFIGVAVNKIGEGRGWFRSAAGLRVENTDLLRRNGELEATLVRKDAMLSSEAARIAVLEQGVRDLEKLDQSAVLSALVIHEKGATERAERTHELQQATNDKLDKIVTALEAA